MHRVARRVIEVDGFHVPLAWLITSGDEEVQILAMDAEDQQDKVVQMRLLASEVDRSGADVVIFITESWLAPVLPDSDPQARLRAGQRDDRGEALITYLLSRTGPNQTWMSVFTREGDRIVLQDAHVAPLTDPHLFEPVLRVWRRWDREAAT